MNIIHMISGGDVGGAKTHISTLLKELSQLETVRLVCFTDGPSAQEARALGVDTVIMQTGLSASLSRLAAMIRDEGFQIVHCHGARANMMGTLLRRRVRVPVITTVHSDYRLDYLGRPFGRLIYGTINTYCLRRIPYHIGVSDLMADLLISRGFDPYNMFVIYNGLDFTPVRPAQSREEFFQSIGLQVGEGDVVFGLAARLSPVKDISTLITGFAKACKQASNLRLVIAGDGEERQQLEALAAELCPPGSYAFAGWVKDTDSFYHAIDVNTLTSLSEGFSYVLTEGARRHCATIATNVGGVSLLIDHGVHGLLFEPKDTDTLCRYMLKLASDEEYRRNMGDAIFERASTHYSVEKTVQTQREIYASVLKREAAAGEKRKGVLICGAYGKGNAGDDSILEAVMQQIRNIDADQPVYVLSRNPKETRLRYRVRAIHTFAIHQFLSIMRKTKLYINGGGSLIQDVTSTRSLQYYLHNILAAKRAGNQVLMYGCGIGPVRSASNRKRAGKIIDLCADIITLRENQSEQELRAMGVTRPDIRITADPVLLLHPASKEKVDTLLLQQNMDPSGQYVMFVLRPWLGFDQVQQHFASVAQQLYREKGLTPVFLALESGRDLPVSHQTAEMLDCPYYVLSAPHDGRLIMGLMGRMKAVISMRLHALIFASGLGTPLVGVVYDPKVSGFMDYLGQSRYMNLEEVSEARLLKLAEEALEEGDNTYSAKHLRSLAEQNEAAARELLEK